MRMERGSRMLWVLVAVASAWGSSGSGSSLGALPPTFQKDFKRPISIPEDGIKAAVEVMRSGRVFRYSSISAEDSQVALLEKEFAEAMGSTYAVGVNSCSSAILIALMCVGVRSGDEVLVNGFTFTALPSAIIRMGAVPVLVECQRSWTMDLDDLDQKAATSNAKVLLLSHMRGKVCDMDRLDKICKDRGLTLVEDCAHGCGVKWRDRQLGYHGHISVYSTQSDKVINSGEGGFLVTDDDSVAAKSIFLAGAYERRYGTVLAYTHELSSTYFLFLHFLEIKT
ncbi:unnamed protein product [Choristocarpus tenellus]